MDRDLVTRIVLVCVAVAAYLTTSQLEVAKNVIAPLLVLFVAVVMFWPRKRDHEDVQVVADEQNEAVG